MLAVGLTGGIGTGKSTVARMLVERGAQLIDADRIAREVVEPGGPAYQPVIDRFGRGVVSADGSIDRPAVAALVFGHPEALGDLNAITHPAIGAEMLARKEGFDTSDAIVVLDIPLLRSEHRQLLDLAAVVVVDAPRSVAVARLVRLRGMTSDDAEARIGSQIDRDQRLEGADFVVDNSGDLVRLEADVSRLWSDLLALRDARRRGPGS
ncbi:MAG: dephospho-CoA kinase [Acidimicrobiales bacterium]